GPHPRAHRFAGAAPRARAAGLPPGARAHDQRLRGDAEGLLARVGAHGRRAHQADADLRDERRELGVAGRALRGAVPRHVAAARAPRAPARGALEGDDRMKDVLRVSGLRLSRGARAILRGVDLHAGAGEIVALMGLSGSGKTTILRVVAGLEPCDAGDVA